MFLQGGIGYCVPLHCFSKGMKHSKELRNFGEASTGCVLRNKAQIPTEKDKVFRFCERAFGYVQKMGIGARGGSF